MARKRTITYYDDGSVQSSLFMFVLYPDSTLYDWSFILAWFKCNCRCAWITHDRDVNEDGELIKPHIHVVAWFDSKQRSRELAKFHKLNVNAFVAWDDLDKCFRYLSHFDDKNKVQYDWHLIESNFDVSKFFQSDNSVNEQTDLIEVITWIRQNHCTLISSLFTFCINNNYLYVYRRYQTTFIQIMKEMPIIKDKEALINEKEVIF